MARMGIPSGGMGHGDRRSGARSMEEGAKTEKKKQSERLRELWPDLREMILPRRGILALGFVLMVFNRLFGIVLPYSTKFLIDDVIGKGNTKLLVPLVSAVLGATLLQGVTSFCLTQLLSKAAQRLIAE